MELRVLEEVTRDGNELPAERGILDLDEEPFSMGDQEGKVLSNFAEVIRIFRMLQLLPRVFQLRAFERLRLKKRRLMDSLSLHAKKDVMMERSIP